MMLQQIIIALFLLLPSLCTSMDNNLSITLSKNQFPEKDFINFDTIQDDYLHQDFEKKWNDAIPYILVKEVIDGKSMYKTVSPNYITQNNHTNQIEMQDTFNTTIIQEINELRATKESLQKELTAKEELKNKIILQNAQLKEQLIAIKKFNAENSSIPYEPAPIIIKQQPTKKITPKKNVNARKKKAASKKKKAFTAAAQNNKPIIQTNASPQNNSNSHESQQKMTAIRCLMKKYNVKTPAQLKNKLHEKCEVKDCHGLKGRINRYCTWNYCICENELLINTNDTKSDSDSDDTSSSDSSDLCVELSID